MKTIAGQFVGIRGCLPAGKRQADAQQQNGRCECPSHSFHCIAHHYTRESAIAARVPAGRNSFSGCLSEPMVSRFADKTRRMPGGRLDYNSFRSLAVTVGLIEPAGKEARCAFTLFSSLCRSFSLRCCRRNHPLAVLLLSWRTLAGDPFLKHPSRSSTGAGLLPAGVDRFRTASPHLTPRAGPASSLPPPHTKELVQPPPF